MSISPNLVKKENKCNSSVRPNLCATHAVFFLVSTVFFLHLCSVAPPLRPIHLIATHHRSNRQPPRPPLWPATVTPPPIKIPNPNSATARSNPIPDLKGEEVAQKTFRNSSLVHKSLSISFPFGLTQVKGINCKQKQM
jgi:hypothetical protein